jgi:hypothetical protein
MVASLYTLPTILSMVFAFFDVIESLRLDRHPISNACDICSIISCWILANLSLTAVNFVSEESTLVAIPLISNAIGNQFWVLYFHI